MNRKMRNRRKLINRSTYFSRLYNFKIIEDILVIRGGTSIIYAEDIHPIVNPDNIAIYDQMTLILNVSTSR